MPVLLGLCLETELTLMSNQVRYLCLNKLFPLPKFILFDGLDFNLSTLFAHIFLHYNGVEIGNLTRTRKAQSVTSK